MTELHLKGCKRVENPYFTHSQKNDANENEYDVDEAFVNSAIALTDNVSKQVCASTVVDNARRMSPVSFARLLRKGEGGIPLSPEAKKKWTMSSENMPRYEKSKGDKRL